MTRTLTIIGSVLFLIGGIGYGLHCLHPAFALAYVAVWQIVLLILAAAIVSRSRS